MVGAGIFSLQARFGAATGPFGAIVAWLVAGGGMLMLAFVFQSLAVRKPDLDAGIFTYAKAGFGDFLGFAALPARCCAADGAYGTLDIALLAAQIRPEPVTWAAALVIKGSWFLAIRLWFDVMPGVVTLPSAQPLGALGAAAILVGNIVALRQARLKLLIAYSTVAQIGYLFLMFPLAFALAGVALMALGLSRRSLLGADRVGAAADGGPMRRAMAAVDVGFEQADACVRRWTSASIGLITLAALFGWLMLTGGLS